MTQVKQGDTITMHYTGTLADGTTFDSSREREPLEFQVGSGQIIPGLDQALQGMETGETKKVEVPAAEAYGERVDEARQTVPRSAIPDNIPLEVGTRLQMQTPEGQVMPVSVAEVTDESVVLDANHPLAGQDLTFDVEIVDVKAA